MNNRVFNAMILACAAWALGLAGCGPERNSTQSEMRSTGSATSSSLDLGDDWDRRGNQTSGRAGGQQGQVERNQWTIVLGTFSGADHAEQARLVHREIEANVPEVRGSRVHSTERGSMLIYGSYTAVDDPRAVADLSRIKESTFNNLPVFARAFLTPLPSARATSTRPSATSQFDLMRARELYPDANLLYTLQVAIWGDFDSGRLSIDEIRRQAENYAQRLRTEGHEAYVHHDDRTKQSLVTVGIFTRSSLNPNTGEFGPDIRAVMRRFPAHLVNGEELLEPIDRRRPDRGTRAQQPFLVIVPR